MLQSGIQIADGQIRLIIPWIPAKSTRE